MSYSLLTSDCASSFAFFSCCRHMKRYLSTWLRQASKSLVTVSQQESSSWKTEFSLSWNKMSSSSRLDSSFLMDTSTSAHCGSKKAPSV